MRRSNSFFSKFVFKPFFFKASLSSNKPPSETSYDSSIVPFKSVQKAHCQNEQKESNFKFYVNLFSISIYN